MHWIDCQNQGCWFLVVICNKLKLIMTFLTPKEQFLKIYWTYCLKIMLLFYLQQVNRFIQMPWAYYTALSMKWKWLQTFLVVFVWGLRLNSSLKRGAVKVKDGNGCGFRFDMSWHLKASQFQIQLWLFNLVQQIVRDGLHELLEVFNVGFMQDDLRQVTLPFDLLLQSFWHVRDHVG